MSDITTRPYRGPEDLRRMQELVQAVWGPGSRCHVGELAWDRFQHLGREPEWPTMLWEHRGRTLAWAWVRLPGGLQFVAPDDLADEVLDWFHETTTGDRLATTILDTETGLADVLTRRGYRPAQDGSFLLRMSRSLDGLDEVEPPPGFTVRHLRGEEDVPERVAAHRSAFHPSRVTEDSYRRVMRAWPYRSDLDCVVEAPDGRLVAYCLAWLDPDNRVGQFEPVGTRREFQRLGLARAACLYAMHRLRAAGAGEAVVYARGDAAHPGPAALYRSLGFRADARTVTYTRSR
ncbi:GNAT family N-acetyltransferase [Planomonospora alba]|uniref:GNAT family N-acetyltransferase n=1 Tax=Planomonospora alba TaxID=161354 RepID=A0ABP6P1A9_9ACTN